MLTPGHYNLIFGFEINYNQNTISSSSSRIKDANPVVRLTKCCALAGFTGTKIYS